MFVCPCRILAYSPEKLQFAAEVRWIDRDNGNVWVLTSRFQKFFMKTVNPRDVNLRIMRIRPEINLPKPQHILNQIGLPTRYYYNRTLDIYWRSCNKFRGNYCESRQKRVCKIICTGKVRIFYEINVWYGLSCVCVKCCL